MDILPGLLTIMTMHTLAVISPGPDFALVVKNSLTRSRKEALFTTLGLSTGLMVHISYCILGLGILISSSPKIYTAMKSIGGCYLLYLCIQSFREAKACHNNTSENPKQIVKSNLGFFLEGFLCNILNVKAILFILFLFSIVIKPSTPISIKILYGVVMVAITLTWFTALTLFISIPKFKQKLSKFQSYLHVMFGAVLGALGVFVLVTQ